MKVVKRSDYVQFGLMTTWQIFFLAGK